MPVEDSSKYLDIAKKLVGESLSSLSNSQYFFNGEKENDDMGDLEIQTSSGLKVCFKLLNDGESVGAYEGALKIPESFEVVEGGQASWEKLAINQGGEITGTEIVRIKAMYDLYLKLNSKVLSGWRVEFSSGDFFVFYNCGDNARFLFNEVPDDAITDVETTWKQI